MGHYRMSERGELRLRHIGLAIRGAAETIESDIGDLDPLEISAMLHLISDAVDTIVAESEFCAADRDAGRKSA